MIASASHPAVVRYVPAGGRHERVGVVALESPVTLREASPDGFRAMGGPDMTAAVLLGEDALWLRLDVAGLGGGRHCPREAFLAWLSGRGAPEADGLSRMLRRTPLSAATTQVSGGGFVTEGHDRGDPREPRAREMLWDGRPGAAARLQGWLDANLRLVGDAVLLRVDPLAEVDPRGEEGLVLLSILHHQAGDHAMLLDLDRIGDAEALGPRPLRPDGIVAEVVEALSGTHPGPVGARILALSLPAAIRDAVVRLPRIGVALPARLDAIARDLRPHADAAMTGTVDDAEVPAILSLCDEAAGLLAEVGPPIDHLRWRRVRDHLRGGLVNGYGGPDPGDEAALGALSPSESDGPALVLRAVDLLEKSGFGDGDMLDHVLDEAGYDVMARPHGDPDDDMPTLGAAVLAACVRRHLVPLLPHGIGIVDGMSHSHNPVRLAAVDAARPGMRERLEGIEARIAPAQALAVAADLAPGFAEARPVPADPAMRGR